MARAVDIGCARKKHAGSIAIGMSLLLAGPRADGGTRCEVEQ
jgi:hypothetical protein